MPAQKRSSDSSEDDPLGARQSSLEQPQDEEEFDRSSSSSADEKDEYIVIKLSDIRKEVQCPICLGIIRKTRTVMECLHRFCRECIDKSMRLGNNECPACRTHCASRRSLRDDPNYDALIAALYPDIDKYEEEELALHEEEKTRNKQIQASIAQTLQRQTEALGKKRTSSGRRSHGNYRSSRQRGRRNSRNEVELQGSDDNEDENGNDGSKHSSSADEQTKARPRRLKRWKGARFTASGADEGSEENDPNVNREIMGASAGIVCSSERLAWGKGGMRSHTRYGSMSGGNGKNARINRLSKLVDLLRNSEEKDDELDMNIMLIPFDEQRIPSLQRPYLSCKPKCSVRQLCEFVALQATLQADEVEVCLVNEHYPNINLLASGESPNPESQLKDTCKDKVQVLREEETLAGIKTHNLSHGYLLLGYRKKSHDPVLQ